MNGALPLGVQLLQQCYLASRILRNRFLDLGDRAVCFLGAHANMEVGRGNDSQHRKDCK
jgi:hypothetical protein